MKNKRTKKCSINEDAIFEIAKRLSTRYYTGGELIKLAASFGYKSSVFTLLCTLEGYGFLTMEEEIRPEIRGDKRDRIRYKVVTAEDYK